MGAYVSVGGIISSPPGSPRLQLITYPTSVRKSNAGVFTRWSSIAACKMLLPQPHIASLVASITASSNQIQMLLASGWVVQISIPAYPAIEYDGQILYAFVSVAALALLTSLIYLVLQATPFMKVTGVYTCAHQLQKTSWYVAQRWQTARPS
jgi:hypothetical protein